MSSCLAWGGHALQLPRPLRCCHIGGSTRLLMPDHSPKWAVCLGCARVLVAHDLCHLIAVVTACAFT